MDARRDHQGGRLLQPARPVSTTPLPGVVETLSGGFDHVNRILWITLFPIVLDLFFWFAPRLSAGPFLHVLVDALRRFYGSLQGNLDPTSLEQARQVLSALDQAAGTFNAWTLLVGGLAVVPSLARPSRGGTLPVEITTGGQFLVALLVFEVIGAILGCVYLGLIAQQVRDGRTDWGRLARRLPFFVGTAFAIIFLALGLILLLSVPVGLVLGLVRVISTQLGDLLTVMAFVAAQVSLILGLIYLFFLLDAIVVSEAGPVRAVTSSARVVARNFWGAVGFILVYVFIDWGLQLAWVALSKTAPGTVLAIVGNAYVASGLAAASMRYYLSRLRV